MLQDLFLKGILIPGVISGLIILLLSLVGIHKGRPWIIPLATGGGYAGAHWAITGIPGFPPLESTQWIFIFTPIATGLGIYTASKAGRGPRRSIFISLFIAVLSLALPALMSIPLFKYTWTLSRGIGVVFLWALFLFILWWLMEKVLEGEGPMPYIATLIVMNSAGGIALILSGSIILGQLAGALSAALVPVGIFLLITKGRIYPYGLPPLAAMITGGLWMGGYLFSEMPLWSIALLGLSILAPVICETPYLRRGTPWKKALISGLIAFIPAALALGIASG